ncbi:SAM-dependent methyltransferase [Nostoc favosum]|uniref:S-adenosyl-L-methionine-dependent methyltransferase n=1 Tax=Nostoc favosum CHAB5714 TaxID=2780399 RepID=A0ABS8IHA1_9NOSO|nr:SAM-dependent methyltransferase [Nostoc favosum]MCC5603180.1 SAM-dependent methyltransferase [Nostoc favosum CHAB5714]
MLSSVGLTSLYVAAARAYETEYRQRLFVDTYARSFAGDTGFALFSDLRSFSPGLSANDPHPGISIRTRFFDDALLMAVHELSLKQVVLVASGMDARAFRLPWMDGVQLFEVDRQEIFQYKEPILLNLNARAKCIRKVVVTDLEQNWATALTDVGFDRHKPAAFLFEGLMFYLKPATVATVLETLQSLACPGSWLGMDFVEAELLNSPYAQPFLSKLRKLGCPWLFGVSNPEQFILQYGWQPRQPKIVVLGEAEANYGRWTFPVSSTTSSVFNHYLVSARRMNF